MQVGFLVCFGSHWLQIGYTGHRLVVKCAGFYGLPWHLTYGQALRRSNQNEQISTVFTAKWRTNFDDKGFCGP